MQRLGPDVSLAILVADNATGEVLAHIGSPVYFANGGRINWT
jgi:penicillin-binding protein 1C